VFEGIELLLSFVTAAARYWLMAEGDWPKKNAQQDRNLKLPA
jgi:hypothetical protein